MHKSQTLLRYSVVPATLLGLLLSSMALAGTEQVMEKKDHRFPVAICLTDTDMGDVTARGSNDSFAYLQGILAGNNDGSNGEDNLINLSNLLVPFSDLLDYDMEMSGVTYADGDATRINPDGSIQLILPVYIEQISYKNIRPKGAESEPIGNVFVNKIDLTGSGALIKDYD
jgi:hypothetical protein